MLAIRNPRRTRTRRGAILLVVLAMLALFAVVALSFVLYAESEATSMRNGRAARNGEADPNPQEAANDFLGVLIFDTNDPTVALYGHGLATTKYGWVAGGGQSYSPYAGSGLYPEDVSALVGLAPGTINRVGMVNYTRNGLPAAPGVPQYVYPHLRADGLTSINKSTPYTYPDRANFYLAMQNPLTGEIVQPSFHRPDLFGSLDPTNGGAASNNWTNDVGRYMITRPRPGPSVPVGDPRRESPNFPLVPANADGTFTGDVQNMKFIAGASQKNDSLWMYAGSPVKTWRNKRYVAMVAPLVLDLNGRVNMSVAGNNRNAGISPLNPSASNQGFGAWEVNPGQLGLDPTEFRGIVAQRYSGLNVGDPPPPANWYSGANTGTINRGAVPPQYSRIDADAMAGVGVDGPMTAAAGFHPFLGFTPRFADTAVNFGTELTDHPQVFNPFHRQRGPQSLGIAHAFGMDDLVKLAGRYSDPKNRYTQSKLGQIAPASFAGNSAAAQQNRALSTAFNVTQSWAEVRLAALGGTATLGPIDLNRPMPDYRNNANPFSTANVIVAGVGPANSARQRLAMDIFLRLAALCPSATNANGKLIDGVVVQYSELAHCLTGLLPANVAYATFRNLAQYAANIVDAIDNDDVSTAFVWNPQAPAPGADYSDIVTQVGVNVADRIVFGTELPRLVVNEAYCKLDNDRSESKDAGIRPMLVALRRPAQRNIQKKYWLELHNPLPQEVAGSVQSDLGAARLQTAAGPNTNIYQVVIADHDPTRPLNAPDNVTGDPTVAGLIIRLTVNDFTPAPAPQVPPAEQILAGDERYLVHQANGTPLPSTNGGNLGYFVLGPVDKFPPPTTVLHSSSLPDPVGATPTINTLISDAGLPSQANIDLVKLIHSTVILRRLANPYLPAQANPALANFNPFITVDMLDNVPTRDRAQYNDQDDRGAGVPVNSPSIGRRHPYANAPIYGAPSAMVIDQVDAALTPAHTFFNANTRYNNTAYIHYDRELINSSELLHVSIHPPHLLTANFSDGTYLQRHTGSSPGSMGALMPNSTFPTGVVGTPLFKAFDLLTTANRMPGIPLGGREPGKINLNTAAHVRVLRAVLDPGQGNRFPMTFVDDAWATTILPTRSPNWGTATYIRATSDETTLPNPDRPFKLAGHATSQYEETLFRTTNPQPGSVPYPFPMLFKDAPGLTQNYIDDEEPHRKAWSNLTTVSDGFLVIWTVGFFEVDSPVGAPVLQFGKELFDKVPGDLRAQYSAVVDRSMLQVPAVPPVPGTNGPKPWETKLMADAPIGSTTIFVEGNGQVYSDGVAVPLTGTIRLGHSDIGAGGDGESVLITGITVVGGSSTTTLTLATPTTRFHGGSTRVSNTIPGNPGPQPLFDASNPLNRHLVPYFTRMEP